MLRFTFKMLATGKTAVPARGMGKIPKQLATRVPFGAARTNSLVGSLLREKDRVVGFEAAGEYHEADAVVVATEALAAGRLTGQTVPKGSVGQLCVSYVVELESRKKIVLNAEDAGFVNNAVQISNVSPLYAPSGQGLLSVVVLVGFDLLDEEIYRRGVEDVTRWYPETNLEPLAIYRVRYAQFARPPDIHQKLPKNPTRTPGLFLAGEYTEDSSINGSMFSGKRRQKR